ncbi:ATP-binding protein [Geotoga petraea]|uniref:histidine kinase n=1 Tax=Geotoga petraea TaxID=28234 RepID=A0A1G6KYY3_9BACT|nr:ATP-binding protein [Geotoga petraea]SDC35695.1 GAF domain-containing protein [Geotoga petraea]
MYDKKGSYKQEFKIKSNILNIKKLIYFSLAIGLISLMISAINFFNSNLDAGLVNLGYSIFSIFISFSLKILSNKDIKSMKKLNTLFSSYIFTVYLWAFKDYFFNGSIAMSLWMFNMMILIVAFLFNQNKKIHLISTFIATLSFSIALFIEGFQIPQLIFYNSIIFFAFIFSNLLNNNFFDLLYKNYESEILINQKDKVIDEIKEEVRLEIQNKTSAIEKLYEETSKTNEKLKKTMEELKSSYSDLNKKSEEHYLLFRISMKFSSSDSSSEKIEYALKLLGEFTNVSRVYIFENDYKNKTTSNTYEWTDYKVEPEINNLQGIPLNDISEWMEMLKEEGMIKSSNIEELPESIKNYLEPQNINSILVLPIFLEDEIFGFIGFDDCESYKNWGKDKIELLRIISTLISHELERKISNEKLKQAKIKAEISNEAKTKFLANMNHEIRTPINTIFGVNSLLLQKKGLDSDSKKLLNMSYEASKNLQDLIENILDFSKIEQGKIELNKTNFNLKNLLDEIIENYKMKNENNVDINFDYNSEIDVFYADKVKIYQIINNIFGNAYNHTESGYISLKFKSEKHLNDEYKLCFTIEDTGKGISEENLEKIFKEFYQVYSENQRNYSGVGLGLPISKKLIEMMDGEINVESLIDKGTKINFSFFVEKGQLHNEKKTGFAKILFNNNKVLLVEDNKVNQEIQKRILQNYDLNVDVVDNGQEAVEIIENNPNKYEIIFMDISMPVMNGFEAISYLRNEVSENKFKIIALTAFTSSIDRKKVFDFGFDDFIPKPIEENELLRILKKFLKDEKQNQNKIENITKNKDILDLFIKDLEEKIPLIENYYDEMNYGKMSEIFHQIKNPFKYLKYEEMYEVAKELEKVAKNNDKNEIKVLYPEFKEKIEDFIKENKE